MNKTKPLSPQSGKLFSLVFPCFVGAGEITWFALLFVTAQRSLQQKKVHFCACSCGGTLHDLAMFSCWGPMCD